MRQHDFLAVGSSPSLRSVHRMIRSRINEVVTTFQSNGITLLQQLAVLGMAHETGIKPGQLL